MSFAGFLDIARKDVDVPAKAPKELLLPQHVQFIDKYMRDKEGYEYVMAEPLRVSGIYWCLSALDIMGELSRADADGIAAYMCECRREDGGYAPAQQHDSHLLHTLSAVQVLVLLERRDLIDADAVAVYVKARFNPDGSFTGDGANEVDTRFSMCALATLHLIDRMDAVDVDKAARFVMSCYNPDGGFGTRPGSESHAGQVYCCVGALKLAGWLEVIDRERTAEWLAQRQCASGGLNGRPEKLPDVCYSWWILASLHMLGRLGNIDEVAMRRFIFACQDDETGGFADRPGDYPDPFHTVFGVASLSLLGGDGAKGLEDVDSLLCMPKNKLHEYATCFHGKGHAVSNFAETGVLHLVQVDIATDCMCSCAKYNQVPVISFCEDHHLYLCEGCKSLHTNCTCYMIDSTTGHKFTRLVGHQLSRIACHQEAELVSSRHKQMTLHGELDQKKAELADTRLQLDKADKKFADSNEIFNIVSGTVELPHDLKLLKNPLRDLIFVHTDRGYSALDCMRQALAHPGYDLGLYAPHPEAYQSFCAFFDPVIKKIHGFAASDIHPKVDFSEYRLKKLEPLSITHVSVDYSVSMTVPFHPYVNEYQLEQMIDSVKSAAESAYAATRFELVEATDDEEEEERKDILGATGEQELYGNYKGKLLCTIDREFCIYPSPYSHVKFVAVGSNIGRVASRLGSAVMRLLPHLDTVRDERLGWLTFNPSRIGKSIDYSKYDISNAYGLGLSEYEAVKQMYDGVKELIRLEESL